MNHELALRERSANCSSLEQRPLCPLHLLPETTLSNHSHPASNLRHGGFRQVAKRGKRDEACIERSIAAMFVACVAVCHVFTPSSGKMPVVTDELQMCRTPSRACLPRCRGESVACAISVTFEQALFPYQREVALVVKQSRHSCNINVHSQELPLFRYGTNSLRHKQSPLSLA